MKLLERFIDWADRKLTEPEGNARCPYVAPLGGSFNGGVQPWHQYHRKAGHRGLCETVDPTLHNPNALRRWYGANWPRVEP